MTKPDPRKAMESFGTLYCDEDVLKDMPYGEGPVEFFTIGRYVTNDELEKEYASRGLVPASPYALAEAHKANPSLAEGNKWTATHWKDTEGKWCFAAFNHWRGERFVNVCRFDGDWRDGWLFAGVPQVAIEIDDVSCQCRCHIPPSTENLDEFVRDICSVVPKSKSEVRRRLSDLLATTRKEVVEHIKGKSEPVTPNLWYVSTACFDSVEDYFRPKP